MVFRATNAVNITSALLRGRKTCAWWLFDDNNGANDIFANVDADNDDDDEDDDDDDVNNSSWTLRPNITAAWIDSE